MSAWKQFCSVIKVTAKMVFTTFGAPIFVVGGLNIAKYYTGYVLPPEYFSPILIVSTSLGGIFSCVAYTACGRKIFHYISCQACSNTDEAEADDEYDQLTHSYAGAVTTNQWDPKLPELPGRKIVTGQQIYSEGDVKSLLGARMQALYGHFKIKLDKERRYSVQEDEILNDPDFIAECDKLTDLAAPQLYRYQSQTIDIASSRPLAIMPVTTQGMLNLSENANSEQGDELSEGDDESHYSDDNAEPKLKGIRTN